MRRLLLRVRGLGFYVGVFRVWLMIGLIIMVLVVISWKQSLFLSMDFVRGFRLREKSVKFQSKLDAWLTSVFVQSVWKLCSFLLFMIL